MIAVRFYPIIWFPREIKQWPSNPARLRSHYLHEEWLYPVEGLAVPASIKNEGRQAYDAIQLFTERAGRVRRDFFWGFALIAANWFIGLAALLVLALLLVRLPREEAGLIERFGDEYRAYMKRTGRLLPRLFH